jgi:hypothetical protein
MDKDVVLLNGIFHNVNKWLEFAERKNTYIFSFFSLIVIFTPFIGKLTSIGYLLKISICLFYAFYIVTIIFTLLSVFPKTNISQDLVKNGRDKKINGKDNLLFFGDISKYSVQEYTNVLIKEYKLPETPNKYTSDIITQIVINSNIVNTKMAYFKKSVILICIAMIQFSICFSISLFL